MFKSIFGSAFLGLAYAQCESWTTVSISAPPESCCTTSWDSTTCDVLQNAYDDASECTIFELGAGTYCNSGYYKNVPDMTYYRNQALLKANDGKNNMQWIAADPDNRPDIKIDGWSGMQAKNCQGLTFKNLNIEGPAMRLDGASASSNRERVTGRDSDYNCIQHTSETDCGNADQCKWSSSHGGECLGNPWAMYVGKCIELKQVTDVLVEGNIVRHCTDSGIRCDQCDNTTIKNNIVYGTVWWTTSASSAIVFAEAQGDGINSMEGNVVYGNRNYLPFFLTGTLSHFGSGVENYGLYNMYSVVDGQGVYLTRNLDYEGSFKMIDNIAFDNGINGVVVHKTTHTNVNVTVEGNVVFDNGATSVEIEDRQIAGGLTINSGDYTSTQYLGHNVVTAQDTDVSYQCFGTCEITAGSANNTYCGGAPSSKIDSTIFESDTNCTRQNDQLAQLRSYFTYSGMKTCPQYTPFIEDANLPNCTEPAANERPCCSCHLPGNTCDTTRSLEPDTCCVVETTYDACDSWTTVDIAAPPESCCTTSWDSSTCDVLQNAYDAASECTIFSLAAGTYCNNGYYKNVPDLTYYRNQALLKANDGKNNMQWVAADPSDKPLIKIDGWSGIQAKNCNGITIKNLEIEGPAMKLDGASASSNRERVTGRDSDYNCIQHTTETDCGNADQCKWSSSHGGECLGNPWAMYVGKCIELKQVTDVLVEGNTVHHCTDSGIRCDQCDNTIIKNNIVYGTVWWTTSASSAIVFAEAQGDGQNSMIGNVVYANRNFLPFFLTGTLSHFGSGVPNYGLYNMYSVVDGQGVYLTRNLDYEGTFEMLDNIAFDNGINGVVVHKTTHEWVTVSVQGNIVFSNGATSKPIEDRQTAGGLTVNSGDYESIQLLANNQVSASDDDVTYQCFGTCSTTYKSGNNTACGGAPSSKFEVDLFNADTNCTAQVEQETLIRAKYTYSGMKVCPQYTPFIEDVNLPSCTEPENYACCDCDAQGNTCDTTRSLMPDTCCNPGELPEDDYVQDGDDNQVAEECTTVAEDGTCLDDQSSDDFASNQIANALFMLCAFVVALIQ